MFGIVYLPCMSSIAWYKNDSGLIESMEIEALKMRP